MPRSQWNRLSSLGKSFVEGEIHKKASSQRSRHVALPGKYLFVSPTEGSRRCGILFHEVPIFLLICT